MRVNFDGHDVTSPYDSVPCPMLHVKYWKCLNSRMHLHTGEKWQTALELKRQPFIEASRKRMYFHGRFTTFHEVGAITLH